MSIFESSYLQFAMNSAVLATDERLFTKLEFSKLFPWWWMELFTIIFGKLLPTFLKQLRPLLVL